MSLPNPAGDRGHNTTHEGSGRFTLTISNQVDNTYTHITHSTLRDARADLVGYQHRNGYWLTVEPWLAGTDNNKQEGYLRQNGAVVAMWRITEGATA